MDQQRLQLIHIGPVVPRPLCIPTVVLNTVRRAIRSLYPHEDSGVTFNTVDISALRQNCVGNHLSNKGTTRRDPSRPLPTSTFPNVNTQKAGKTWFWYARTLHPILHALVEEGINTHRRVRPTPMCPDV